jgi:hypothetical protein
MLNALHGWLGEAYEGNTLSLVVEHPFHQRQGIRPFRKLKIVYLIYMGLLNGTGIVTYPTGGDAIILSLVSSNQSPLKRVKSPISSFDNCIPAHPSL